MKLHKERMVRMLKEVTGAHTIQWVKFELVNVLFELCPFLLLFSFLYFMGELVHLLLMALNSPYPKSIPVSLRNLAMATDTIQIR